MRIRYKYYRNLDRVYVFRNILNTIYTTRLYIY